MGSSKRRVPRALVAFLILLLLVLIIYSLYYPIVAESLYDMGKDLYEHLYSPFSDLKEWSFSLPYLNKVLYVEKGEGRIPSTWTITLPINLAERDEIAVVDSLKRVFPKGIYSFKKDLTGARPALEANLFFLTTHRILFKEGLPEAKLSIVIDDLGEVAAHIDSFTQITLPLTMSVLPQLPYSTRHALMVVEEGQELLLHQPMEPLNTNLCPGPGAIYKGMEREEIREILDANLSYMPQQVVGVNNHMGSLVTQDEEVMREVLLYLRERGLFFLDSSTAADSIVPTLTLKMEMPPLRNHLFLDNIDEYSYICQMLEMAGSMALERGELIAIGHARAQTAQAILDTLPFFEERGVELVHLTSLMDELTF